MLKLFKKGHPSPLIASNISSLVQEGGDYFAQELILVNEPLSANLYCAESAVIEHAAVLTGNTIAKLCVISGVVNGNVNATERIEIKKTAVIKGKVIAPVIDIEPGAKINGVVKVTTDIYAMVSLAEALKNHLPAEVLPPTLNIAAESVALTPKTDEPAKAAPQKPNMPKPVAAAMPTNKQPELVTVADKPVAAAKPLAAAVPVNQPVEVAAPAPKTVVAAAPAKPVEEAVLPIIAKPVVAAAPPAKKEADEAANGRWW